jgi:flagellar hook-basal body complex protein FliE
MKWTHGVPTVPVRDLAVHPRENDLIIGTHGRSIYIIDDISPLREISDELLKKKLHLFKVQDAVQFQQGRMSSHQSPGDTVYAGENKRMGACFTYFLIPSERKTEETESAERDETRQQMMARMRQMGGRGQFPGMRMGRTSSRVAITIENSEGKAIASLNGTENKGINRVYWNFREQEPRTPTPGQPRGFMRGGMTALPGEYTVKIKYDDQEMSQPFTFKSDPRIEVDLDVLKTNYEKGKKAQNLSSTINSAGQQIEETQKAVQTVVEAARTVRSPKTRDLMKAARELEAKLKELSEILNPTPPKQGIADRSAGLRTQVMRAVSGITRAGNEPISQAAEVMYEKVKAKLETFLEKFNSVFQTDVENFKKMLEESDFSLFKPFKPLKLEDK